VDAQVEPRVTGRWIQAKTDRSSQWMVVTKKNLLVSVDLKDPYWSICSDESTSSALAYGPIGRPLRTGDQLPIPIEQVRVAGMANMRRLTRDEVVAFSMETIAAVGKAVVTAAAAGTAAAVTPKTPGPRGPGSSRPARPAH
jgi:hypothetical protein